MIVEFENAEDVVRDLNQKTVREEITEFQAELQQQPGMMKAILRKGQEHSVREILEYCLAEADQTENLIVVRFKVEEKHDGNCEGSSGNTMMCITGRHAAVHALHLLGRCREALGKQLAEEFFKEQMKEAMAKPGNALGQFLVDLLRSLRDDQDEPKS